MPSSLSTGYVIQAISRLCHLRIMPSPPFPGYGIFAISRYAVPAIPCLFISVMVMPSPGYAISAISWLCHPRHLWVMPCPAGPTPADSQCGDSNLRDVNSKSSRGHPDSNLRDVSSKSSWDINSKSSRGNQDSHLRDVNSKSSRGHPDKLFTLRQNEWPTVTLSSCPPRVVRLCHRIPPEMSLERLWQTEFSPPGTTTHQVSTANSNPSVATRQVSNANSNPNLATQWRHTFFNAVLTHHARTRTAPC